MGGDWVMSMKLISALLKETSVSSLAPCSLWRHSKKTLPVNQEASPNQRLNLLDLDLGLPILQSCEE